jgi:hypothetical protein
MDRNMVVTPRTEAAAAQLADRYAAMCRSGTPVGIVGKIRMKYAG